MRYDTVRFVIVHHFTGEIRYRSRTGKWTANVFEAALYKDTEAARKSSLYTEIDEIHPVTLAIETE